MFAALCAALRETAFGADPAEPAANAVLSLDQVLGEVLASNPSLKAAHANWEAVKQRVPRAMPPTKGQSRSRHSRQRPNPKNNPPKPRRANDPGSGTDCAEN